MSTHYINNLFLESAMSVLNPFIATDEAVIWMKQRNQDVDVVVKKIPFNKMACWSLDKKDGALKHTSGQFFSIRGIEVNTNWGKTPRWQQPIINQPEIGYLGIITKIFDGVLCFLLQAKIEPGNVNNVQLSPTLQATRSNYSRVHKGKKPLYLEYFQNVKPEQVLLDQLQSEQGARFLKKRNRNMIIMVDEHVPVYDDFVWLTLGQIKKLMTNNNLVNMDTRTVISGIPFDTAATVSLPLLLKERLLQNTFENEMLLSAIDKNNALHSFDEILNWLTALKCRYDLELKPVSLFEIDNWTVNDDFIGHVKDRYFRVIATEVEISSREVMKWSQPLVEPLQQGISTFVTKKINGIFHFLVQAKLECGNFDILEMAPTVQCITGSYDHSSDVPFLNYVLNARQEQIRYDTLQSEEGGRFYREQNKNMIIEADESFSEYVPENYIWITFSQLNTFLKFNNYLNIQARSLLSSIRFI